ncbi:hypothetical protein DF034_21275 [Burkholderia anthina]|nr:hypothetical protein CFB35_26160 [Burkholderia sp. AU16482]RQX80832.1 hypothetical protein DF034_21275 [Burkholderia anthina]
MLLRESNNRGDRAVASSSARSVPMRCLHRHAPAYGRHPGIGTQSLRMADTIRANAPGRPDGARRPGGDRC